MTLEGLVDGLAFEANAREVLAPELRPGDTVVMDNLSAHKRAEARAIIKVSPAGVLHAARGPPLRKGARHS